MRHLSTALLLAVLANMLSAQYPSRTTPPVLNSYSQKVTFAVDKVKANKEELPVRPYQEVINSAFVESVMLSDKYAHEDQDGYVVATRQLECYSRDRRPMTDVNTNGFFETVHLAYSQHRPLVLSPDMVWLAIVQGFARHVNENSDALRAKLVQHQGKKRLNVDMTGKVQLGNDNSDWEWVFQQFQDSIASNTSPEMAELIAGRFSGTNSDAAVAFDIALMDAMKTYFDYWGHVLCGIPEITLEGSPEDWIQIEQRAARLRQYDLDWWLNDLKPILAEFTQTSRGKPNPEFWKSIVNDMEEPICGGDTYITGWVIRLFPYIKRDETYIRNPILGLKRQDIYKSLTKKALKQRLAADRENMDKEGYVPAQLYSMCEGNKYRSVEYIGPKVSTDEVPSGISTAILHVNDNGVYHKMELKSGFVGIRQEENNKALRPVIGWAIIETGEKPDMAENGRGN